MALLPNWGNNLYLYNKPEFKLHLEIYYYNIKIRNYFAYNLHVYMSNNIFKDHEELAERLKKTLYYGKTPTSDRPSLPLTGSNLYYSYT